MSFPWKKERCNKLWKFNFNVFYISASKDTRKLQIFLPPFFFYSRLKGITFKRTIKRVVTSRFSINGWLYFSSLIKIIWIAHWNSVFVFPFLPLWSHYRAIFEVLSYPFISRRKSFGKNANLIDFSQIQCNRKVNHAYWLKVSYKQTKQCSTSFASSHISF